MNQPETELVELTDEQAAAFQDMIDHPEHYAAKEAEWEAAGRPLAPMNEDNDN